MNMRQITFLFDRLSKVIQKVILKRAIPKGFSSTMHILYGGLRYDNEYFSSKYKSVWTDKFVFKSPPQSICFSLGNHLPLPSAHQNKLKITLN